MSPIPDVTALSPAIEQAFDSTETLAVEFTMDATTQAKLAKAMLASDFAWMDRRLDERQRRLLADVAGQYDIAVTQLRLLQPWAVTAMFSFPPAELQRQMNGSKPLDLQLMDKAKASGKRLIALEKVEEQLDAFTDYSEPEQIADSDRDSGKRQPGRQDFARMKDAYLAGQSRGPQCPCGRRIRRTQSRAQRTNSAAADRRPEPQHGRPAGAAAE